MKNYVAAVVVAVPVCRPARPAKGASIVSGAKRIGGNMLFAHGSASFAGGNATFADGNTSFWYGNAAAQTFGRAHRHRPYHSNTCRRSAKVKTKILMLAVTLQAMYSRKLDAFGTMQTEYSRKLDAFGTIKKNTPALLREPLSLKHLTDEEQ